MNEYNKTLIKLLGFMTKELAIIAANLSFSNIIKTTAGAERDTMLKEISSKMSNKLNLIDKIIKEVIDD